MYTFKARKWNKIIITAVDFSIFPILAGQQRQENSVCVQHNDRKVVEVYW